MQPAGNQHSLVLEGILGVLRSEEEVRRVCVHAAGGCQAFDQSILKCQQLAPLKPAKRPALPLRTETCLLNTHRVADGQHPLGGACQGAGHAGHETEARMGPDGLESGQ